MRTYANADIKDDFWGDLSEHEIYGYEAVYTTTPAPDESGHWQVLKRYVNSGGSVKAMVVSRYYKPTPYGTKIDYYYNRVSTFELFDAMKTSDADLRAAMPGRPRRTETKWDPTSLEYGVVTFTTKVYYYHPGGEKPDRSGRTPVKSELNTIKKGIDDGKFMMYTMKQSVNSNYRVTQMDASGGIYLYTGYQQTFEIKQIQLFYQTAVFNFDIKFNSDIRERIESMEKLPEIRMEIVAHTSRQDPTGKTNQQLSDERAKTVYDEVQQIIKSMYPDIEQPDGSFIPDPKYTDLMNRISFIGKGESEAEKAGKPESDNSPSDRRVDINFKFEE